MDDEKRLREIAYELWVAEGYPVGQDDRHWRMAKQMLKEEQEAERVADKPANEKKPNKN